jgi:hypothetical protein
VKARVGQLAARKTSRLERAVLERRAGEIDAADRRHTEQAALEPALREVDSLQRERCRKQDAAEGPAGLRRRPHFVLGDCTMGGVFDVHENVLVEKGALVAFAAV